MRIWVVAVGRLKDRGLREAADDYLKRIRRYVRCEELEARDDAALGRAIPPGVRRVALEVKGEALTSEGFAKRLEHWGATGKGEVAFLIGGAEGIPEELSRSAEHRMSLSTLTLPHRLARLLLFEQIYRGFSILRGEPYARED